MIATQILIFIFVMSSARFITCPSATDAITKSNTNNNAVVKDKPADPTVVKKEMAQSNNIIVNNSVPALIRQAVSKSIGFISGTVTKPWKVIKSYITVHPNATGTQNKN